MRKKPVIVYVAHDVGGQGGMELHLEEIITRLKHQCELVVVSTTLKLSQKEGIRHIYIPVIARPAPIRMIMFAVLATIRIFFLKRDLLHTTGAIVFNQADYSTIHFCHDGFIRAVGNTRANLDQSFLRKLNSRAATSIALIMERMIYVPKRTKHLIAVSKRVQRELLDAFPYKPTEVSVVPNGVDLTKFKPAEGKDKNRLRKHYGLDQEKTYLLFMGGDWPRKGLDYLIDAFNKLADSFPDIGLLVVGKGDPTPYKNQLRPEAREQVVFAGMQSKPEEWMALSDIFVFPSSYETFSLVVHEAAAAGLIILTTEVGGIEDLIRNGKDGIYIERDADNIYHALKQVLSDYDDHLQMGVSVRERVRSLTWENTYEKMMKQYMIDLAKIERRGGQLEHLNE
ncbi:glycosyltransferase family 4 protein [Paenibacillus sp. 1P07SE]|uniref:glycosyltransferase family 4 protein n=1 Tax=Paenibacillus sp. 1P07SE TaxID=3132209 RepID=UPI0039A575EE